MKTKATPFELSELFIHGFKLLTRLEKDRFVQSNVKSDLTAILLDPENADILVFIKQDASRDALTGEFLPEFNEHHWCYWRLVSSKDEKLKYEFRGDTFELVKILEEAKRKYERANSI